MPVQLFTSQNWIIAALAIVALAAMSIARHWLTHRTKVLSERLRNDRLFRAIDGASPEERPKIIQAFGRLERPGE
ncbi:hypothetical protein [Amycolatopsis sp. 195334CR]|uniref:hypothetical protein n=1 Tax=Amycolatopsis sp. 195334CR TaxID=2814588 RepID=UPI001A8F43C0|nr:hypothetical protein [Amycolatopsis sp. 195334CR]MBN6035960.1 hypothetical protein [Amycolatopsis sp. 195334CR]